MESNILTTQVDHDIIILYHWKTEKGSDYGELVALLSHHLLTNALNLHVWMDKTNLLPGDNLKEKVKEAICTAKVVFILLFPSCLDRCKNENDFF